MKVVAKQWFLLKQLLLRPLCSILKVKVEDERDSKTKVSETTLCETPIIYLESESVGKVKCKGECERKMKVTVRLNIWLKLNENEI